MADEPVDETVRALWLQIAELKGKLATARALLDYELPCSDLKRELREILQ